MTLANEYGKIRRRQEINKVLGPRLKRAIMIDQLTKIIALMRDYGELCNWVDVEQDIERYEVWLNELRTEENNQQCND